MEQQFSDIGQQTALDGDSHRKETNHISTSSALAHSSMGKGNPNNLVVLLSLGDLWRHILERKLLWREGERERVRAHTGQ